MLSSDLTAHGACKRLRKVRVLGGGGMLVVMWANTDTPPAFSLRLS